MGKADVTRERILEAAMAEFSAYGVAGARVDRIAKTAGCNKNLIYVYFGNKETLFTTVLDKHLSRVYAEMDPTPEDLPGKAGRVFDFAMENRDLMRLLAWSNLEEQATEPAARAMAQDSKVAGIAAAQAEGKTNPDFPADFLLTVVMTLATAYTAANPFGHFPEETEDTQALREHIVEAVRLMTNPAK
ncbi:TetR/AcrR family transcriptional regulator [Kribbella qitaiheensis]|uniref:TetR/AcrR family transcriptional regulator n=1 Tax=Kribbella qitaiheensis TaxID=1544730 RepID=A0A7G6WRI3_9ACTN|nr:TetR family transcriptional regulator [Kribbella qitaiheensis]QNE16598.1 TetR/AcrR family transcriptional regulator [Kribbella qitaiheensis]